jgi:hypothetical protein
VSAWTGRFLKTRPDSFQSDIIHFIDRCIICSRATTIDSIGIPNSLVLEMETETTDVIICGCGPTGAMLSAYLGRLSVNNIVLEKELEITQDPRGIALDEDGIRFLQGLGIYDKIFTEIGQSELIQAGTTIYMGIMLTATNRNGLL